jgi:uncharacterized protein
MFIKIKDLELRRIVLDESIAPGTIELGEDIDQTSPLGVTGRAELLEEHRGGKNVVEDIRLVGRFTVDLQRRCARCLDPVPYSLDEAFDLVYRPQGVDAHGDEVSISRAETEIGYYQGEGLALEDVLKEQILLALPIKQVCRDDCKGLCPQCGRNLNLESCDCVSTMVDPRWADLEDIRKKLQR